MSNAYVPFRPDKKSIDVFFEKALKNKLPSSSEAVVIGDSPRPNQDKKRKTKTPTLNGSGDKKSTHGTKRVSRRKAGKGKRSKKKRLEKAIRDFVISKK